MLDLTSPFRTRGLPAILAIVVLGAAGVGIARWNARISLERAFEQVEFGMTEAEVEKILGRPGAAELPGDIARTHFQLPRGHWRFTTAYTQRNWTDEENYLLVTFVEGRVAHKMRGGRHPEMSPLERMRLGFRL